VILGIVFRVEIVLRDHDLRIFILVGLYRVKIVNRFLLIFNGAYVFSYYFIGEIESIISNFGFSYMVWLIWKVFIDIIIYVKILDLFSFI